MTLLPQPARRAATFDQESQGTRNKCRIDNLRLPRDLERFGEAYKIEYPLLSDVGSKVIKEFGILNTNIPEDHKMMYGIPWSGDFLIAPDGTVRDKLFQRNYEHRASASEITLRHYGSRAGGNSIDIKADMLSATVSLSTDRCFPGQELGVELEVHLKAGWHVYGKPLPENYQATELTFEGPLVDEQSLEMPPAKPMLLKALNDTLPVYEEEFVRSASSASDGVLQCRPNFWRL